MKTASLVISLLLVVAAETTLLYLAQWQYGRMLEQQALFKTATNSENPPVPLDTSQKPFKNWQKVKLRGVYTHSREKVLINQRLDKRVGQRVITPILSVSGHIHLVDRGWIKNETSLGNFTTKGEVEVEGVVRQIKPRSGVFQGPVYGLTKKEIMRVEGEPFDFKEEPTYYIQATKSRFPALKAQADLPKNGDQNLEYMLTWAVLAIILPLMYGYLLWSRRYTFFHKK